MAAIASPPPLTIGAHLERARLGARADRVAAVLGALAERERDYHCDGISRPPLSAAIRDFRCELGRIHARLRELEALEA